jgi:hypothetical protein
VIGFGVFVGLGVYVADGLGVFISLSVYVAVAAGGVFVGVEGLPFAFVQAAATSIAAIELTVSILYSSFIFPPGGILVSL